MSLRYCPYGIAYRRVLWFIHEIPSWSALWLEACLIVWSHGHTSVATQSTAAPLRTRGGGGGPATAPRRTGRAAFLNPL